VDRLRFLDLIQPSFMFMVGVAIPYSYAARKAKNESERQIWFHTVLRAMLLVAAGGLPDLQQPEADQLPFHQRALSDRPGYCVVYALHGRGLKVQGIALAVILAGYWLVFALFTPMGAISACSASRRTGRRSIG